MSDVERLVLEKHELLRQARLSAAVMATVLKGLEEKTLTLKAADVEANRSVTVVMEQTARLIKLRVEDEAASM